MQANCLNNGDSEGSVLINNKEWAEKVQMYGLQGLSKGAWHRYSDRGFKHYQVIFPGYKYNMMDIQAALGIHKLKRVNKYHKIREKIWKKRDQAFQVLPLMAPAPAEKNTVHALHLYTLLLDIDKIRISRDTFQQALHNENIGAVIHFVALHLHPYYANTFVFKRGDFPNAKFVSDRTISLPLSAKLTEEDADDVIHSVKKIIEKHCI